MNNKKPGNNMMVIGCDICFGNKCNHVAYQDFKSSNLVIGPCILNTILLIPVACLAFLDGDTEVLFLVPVTIAWLTNLIYLLCIWYSTQDYYTGLIWSVCLLIAGFLLPCYAYIAVSYTHLTLPPILRV